MSETITAPAEEIIVPPEGGPSELVLVKRPNPATIFTDQTFIEALLAKIEEAATAFEPDLTTDKGRKKIASQAYRVAQTKTYLDGMGKDLVADYKELPKLIDAGRKTLRDRLDILRDKVRQPLTDLEAEQERQQKVIAGIRCIPTACATATADTIQSTIDSLGTETEDFPGFTEAKTETLATLREMLAKRQAHEAEQAELARLREEAEARRKADEAAEIARKAAEQATKDAEARAQAEKDAAYRREQDAIADRNRAEQAQKDAEARLDRERSEAAEREAIARREAAAEERRRQEEQQATDRRAAEAREQDQANRKRVMNEALEDLKAQVPTYPEGIQVDALLKKILLAVEQGKVRHTRIEF